LHLGHFPVPSQGLHFFPKMFEFPVPEQFLHVVLFLQSGQSLSLLDMGRVVFIGD